MRTLYAINSELDLIIATLESDECDEESVNAAIDAWLDANQEEVTQKIDDYCAVIQERTQVCKMRKEEAKTLSAMAATDERISNRLKERARLFFERANITKMETLRFKPRVQANGGVRSVKLFQPVIDDPHFNLPDEFLIVTYAPNIEAIRKALEQGREVPGATLEERASHFRIR